MRRACRLAAAPWAAIALAICAGCDGAPRGRGATSADGPAHPAGPPRELALDRQPPGRASRVPMLEGTAGKLRHRPGCLFLDLGGDEEIGLVVPAEARFDGRRIVGGLTTPDGRPIAREIGQLVSFSGPVIENPRDGRYSCDTARLLIADSF